MFKKKEEIKTWDMTYELQPNPEELEEMFDWNWYPVKINIVKELLKGALYIIAAVYLISEEKEDIKKANIFIDCAEKLNG